MSLLLRTLKLWVVLAVVFVSGVTTALARPPEARRSTWFGFERLDFTVDGRNCLLIVPETPAEGSPWIWRTEFFGHEPQADRVLASKGFHVAYMDVQNMYGAPVALDHMDRFHEFLVKEFRLSSKPVLEGFSRGGLFSLNWAARNPTKVSCIYNDAPVCDFKSWPGGKGRGPGSKGDWEQCLRVYGLTEQQGLEYKLNPVDNLAPLAREKVPLLHVCGDADEVVPFDENTRLLADRYEKLGGPITVIAKPGVKHHPHSLQNPYAIVDFVLKHTIGGSASAVLPETPVDYQVIQRKSRLAGVVAIKGLVSIESGNVEARFVLPGTDPANVRHPAFSWQNVQLDGTAGRFSAEIEVAAGGWYRLELRVVANQKPLTLTTIDHVGVGEVFVIAGQSNSTNYGSEKLLPETLRVATFDGTSWRLAIDPQPGTHDGSTGGSFAPAFGDELARRFNVPIGVASTGAGATSVRQWLPKGEKMTNLPTIDAFVKPAGQGSWEATGELFDRMTTRLKALGPNGCRGVLWHQGESDAGQARAGYPADRQITGKQYTEFLEKVIRGSRKQVGWEVPWFVAQATYHTEDDAADEEFRNAQKEVWK
ncbi:MAG: prolyl oligopeptidase family serine peptidase, partial [Planctomycetota bacterium]|nr:prolyl oligopeptidase family serine peptidase [Planctomycetota bacterium]